MPQRKTLLPRGFFRYSAIELLVVLLLLIITAPLVQDLPAGDLVEVALLTLVEQAMGKQAIEGAEAGEDAAEDEDEDKDE